MMPSELWEIVRADELKAGDVAAFGQVDEIYRFVPSHVEIEADGVRVTVAETEDKIELEYAFLCDEPVLRRHTGHHPDVLMRAIEMTTTRLRDIDPESSEAHPDGFIRQAESEIAKERES